MSTAMSPAVVANAAFERGIDQRWAFALDGAEPMLRAAEDAQISAWGHEQVIPHAINVETLKADRRLSVMKDEYVRQNHPHTIGDSKQPPIYILKDDNDPLSFAVQQASYVERRIHEIKYEEIYYPLLLPVSTEASDWARSITYFVGTPTGSAGWLAGGAKDIPLASDNREKREVPVEMLGSGYDYTLEEINYAQLVPNYDITFRKASAARFHTERFLDRVFLYGESEHTEHEGLFNSSNVTATNAAGADAAGRLWSGKTPAAILADVNAALTGVYESTRTIELADTVLLPPSEFSRLASTQMPDINRTVLEFLMTANVYTATMGRPLTIRAIPGLEDAGRNSNDGRLVAYKNDPMILRAHMPMEQRFLPVFQQGPMSYLVVGIARVGGMEILRPSACRYVDGISS